MKKVELTEEEKYHLRPENFYSYLDRAHQMKRNGLDLTTMVEFNELSQINKRYLIKNMKRKIQRNIVYMYFSEGITRS